MWSGEDRPGYGFESWTRKAWVNYFYAQRELDKYKKIDREEGAQEDERLRKWMAEVEYPCMEEVELKDSWD